jgi:hypothetical protein
MGSEALGNGTNGRERHTRRRRLWLAVLCSGLVVAFAPAAAQASFHLMKVREVYPAGNASYVELQMTAAAQYLVSGHHLDTYNANGSLANDFMLPANVSSGSPNNATILIADSGYAAAFPSGPTRDEEDTNLDLSAAGGAVCWTDGTPPDCVAWGNFTGPFPSHVPALVAGSPVSPSGVTSGKAIRRTIAPGCSTLLEDSDDSDVSSADFSEVTPAPRNNASGVTETACAGVPNTTIDESPPANSNSQTAAFTYFAAGATSYECKLDTPTFTSCPSSGIEYPGLAEGGHNFQVRGVNASGPDLTPATFSWNIDLVKPTATIDTHPADPSSGASPAFTYHSEAGSTFECSLVEFGQPEIFATCPTTGKTFATITQDGKYVFSVKAKDPATNQGDPTTFSWNVDTSLGDTTPPVTTIKSTPTDPTESATASFTYESNEPGSTFECKLDAGAFASCPSSGVTYDGLGLGPHSFQVVAIDASNNRDQTPAGFSFTVVAAPPPPAPPHEEPPREEPPARAPDTKITLKPPAKTHDRTATIKFKSTVGGASYQCKIDGQGFKSCRSPLTTKSLSFGRHTVKVRAIAGGVTDPTPAKVSFKVVRG